MTACIEFDAVLKAMLGAVLGVLASFVLIGLGIWIGRDR